MTIIRSGKTYTSYGSLIPGECFDYEGKIFMVIDETDPDTSDRTYASVNLESGAVTLVFANGTLVLKTGCELKVKYD